MCVGKEENKWMTITLRSYSRVEKVGKLIGRGVQQGKKVEIEEIKSCC